MDTNHLRILAVDDNPDNLTTLKAVIADALPRAQVQTALNGRQGIALALEEEPDVILLDVVMPGMDGFEVCRALKRDDRLEHIPVIFLTAQKSDRDIRLKALDAGAEAFLSKPLDEVELLAQIRAMAKIKAAGDAQRQETEQLAALVAERTRDILKELGERRKAEQELQEANRLLLKSQAATLNLMEDLQTESATRQKSENRYRLLFEEMHDGFALHEIICDEQGKPCDYRYLEANPAFERQTELRRGDLIGKTVRQVLPDIEEEWIETYGRVALTGTPISFEQFTGALGKYYQVSAYAPQPGQFATIFADITDRKKHEREMQAIATVSAALRTAATRDEMLPAIVDQTALLLTTEGIALGLRDPATGESVVAYGAGSWAIAKDERMPPGQGISGRVFETKESYVTADLANDPVFSSRHLIGNIRGAACIPLIARDQAIGWLFAGVCTAFADEDVRILKAIADIAANAIHRAALHEEAQRVALELELAYETTLEGWANALELRDQETEGHARRVVQMTLELARALKVGEEELEHIRRGALLHDIGKMGIPDSILLKPGTLNEREWEIMRRHPEYAYKLLAPIDYLRRAVDIPYAHHEKWDGTGYPRGLRGEEIPLAARIFALVDVWDALSAKRPYRAAWDARQVYEYISTMAGTHFDPAIVPVFLEMIAE